jgi:dephospho-CoA kinase
MMKIIVLGPQCSGKTTIANDLKTFHLLTRVIDEDEEISRRNGGKSPSDWTEWTYKWTVLRPSVQKDVLSMADVIFFTSFFDTDLLLQAKRRGFIVIQLTVSDEVFKERNRKRMEEGVDDAAYGWSINLPYHADIRSKGLVDLVLDTNRPMRESSELILLFYRTRHLALPHLQTVGRRLA